MDVTRRRFLAAAAALTGAPLLSRAKATPVRDKPARLELCDNEDEEDVELETSSSSTSSSGTSTSTHCTSIPSCGG